jgi:hypothetical protein
MASSRIKKPAKRSQRELRSIFFHLPSRTRVRTAGEFGIVSVAKGPGERPESAAD